MPCARRIGRVGEIPPPPPPPARGPPAGPPLCTEYAIVTRHLIGIDHEGLYFSLLCVLHDILTRTAFALPWHGPLEHTQSVLCLQDVVWMGLDYFAAGVLLVALCNGAMAQSNGGLPAPENMWSMGSGFAGGTSMMIIIGEHTYDCALL